MKYTPNLNLKKPDVTDYVRIGDLNDNMDILDQEVQDIRGVIDQKVQDIQGVIDQEVQSIRDLINQEVEDIQDLIDQKIQEIQGIIDQEIQDIIDQKVQDIQDTIDQKIQDIRGIIDQEVQDIRDLINQEIQGIQGIIDREVQDIRGIINQEVGEIWDIIDDLESPVYYATLTVTLDTDGWTGTEAPFEQIREVPGILATDVPIADVVLSGDWEVDQARLEAWGHIYRIVTSEDSITAYAREKPDVALPLQLKAVREIDKLLVEEGEPLDE